MGDFIKELNIVDFLGMLLPGSFLILLFSMDYPMEIFFINYFGTNIEGGVKAILLIICGYFAGMIIHEIGDLTEKLLHFNVYLNPRFYAAKAVGFDKIVSCSKKTSYNISKILPTANDKHMKRLEILSFLAIIIWLAILEFSFCVCILEPAKLNNNIIVFVIFFVICTVILITLMNKLNKKAKNKQDYFIHKTVLNLNSEIQSIMFDKGTVTKRRVFDGFHVMMRNIIIVIAIVQSYVYLTQNSEKQLYSLILTIHNTPWMRIVFFVTICLIIIRWIHYVYLKYKYLYEDFVIYCTEEHSK